MSRSGVGADHSLDVAGKVSRPSHRIGGPSDDLGAVGIKNRPQDSANRNVKRRGLSKQSLLRRAAEEVVTKSALDGTLAAKHPDPDDHVFSEDVHNIQTEENWYSEVERLRSELARFREESDRYEMEVAARERERDEKLYSLQQELNVTSKEKSDLEASSREANQKLQLFEKEIRELRRRLESQTANSSSASEQLESVQRDRDRLNVRLSLCTPSLQSFLFDYCNSILFE